MAFTDFFCDFTNGSNLNSGSTEAAAVFSGAGDSDGTSVFTPSDGQTPASTVTVGMFGAVYVTSGATVAAFVGRITTVAAGVNGAVTFSTTAKSGTFPTASAGAHTITMVVGGPWKGPNSASGFPFTILSNNMTNAAGNITAINLKNNATYSITAVISAAHNACRVQGYSSTVRDGGRAIIDGGTSGTSYNLLSLSGSAQYFEDIIFQNNGGTGSSDGVSANTSVPFFRRCVVNSVRGSGFNVPNATGQLVECEAYSCNQSNTSGKAGIVAQMASYCISHDNTGANSAGFLAGSSSTSCVLSNCIADTNGGDGFRLTGLVAGTRVTRCDAYNNGAAGLDIAQTSNIGNITVDSCNFTKNGTYGILQASGNTINGALNNNGFGAGTQVNTSGTTSLLATTAIIELGSVTYASGVTPWVDPANGDFRISLPAAKGAGRGAYTQTQASYAGTIGYPDIGSAQHKEPARKIPTI